MPPGVCPRWDDELAVYEGWYDQCARHHWWTSTIVQRRGRRAVQRDAERMARVYAQAHEAMADGVVALRARLERPRLTRHLGRRFEALARVANGEVRTDIAAYLATIPPEPEYLACLLVGVGDARLRRGEPVEPSDVEAHVRAVVPLLTPEVVNGMAWPTWPYGCVDEGGHDSDEPLWVCAFRTLPTGLPDRVCKSVFESFVQAGASVQLYHATVYCRSNAKHVPEPWKDHLEHLLLVFIRQHLRRRIEEGADLHELASQNHWHPGFIELLERAGLDLAALDPEVMKHAIAHRPALAERAIVAKVAAGQGFNELPSPPLYDAVTEAARHLRQTCWGPWRPHEQEALMAEQALRRRIVDRLIDAGADLNQSATERSDGNPVLAAIEGDDLDMVHHLHRRGARVDLAIEVLQSPDHWKRTWDKEAIPRRIAALMAIQQDELREVADQALAELPEPRAVARPARRRL